MSFSISGKKSAGAASAISTARPEASRSRADFAQTLGDQVRSAPEAATGVSEVTRAAEIVAGEIRSGQCASGIEAVEAVLARSIEAELGPDPSPEARIRGERLRELLLQDEGFVLRIERLLATHLGTAPSES